jgi:hypothetical protein
MGISIRIDMTDTEQRLRALGRQLPYAAMVAINRTVEDALAAVSRKMRSDFTIRVPGFDLPPQQLPTSVRATKDRQHAQVRLGYEDTTGAASIGARREQIFKKHEDGTLKVAKDASFPIAIPTTAIRSSFAALVPRSSTRLICDSRLGCSRTARRFRHSAAAKSSRSPARRSASARGSSRASSARSARSRSRE